MTSCSGTEVISIPSGYESLDIYIRASTGGASDVVAIPFETLISDVRITK